MRIVLIIAAIAIFCAGYFNIFGKKDDGYYADYGSASPKGYDVGYDYTDSGVTSSPSK